MQFAVVMSLVLFASTAILLYQFWAGSLVDAGTTEEAAGSSSVRPPALARPPRPDRSDGLQQPASVRPSPGDRTARVRAVHAVLSD